jgi:hypothetical protein
MHDHGSRMDGRYPGVSREVPIVQRKDIGQAVNQHGGHKPGIMHFGACHCVADDQATPFHMDALAVWQEPNAT